MDLFSCRNCIHNPAQGLTLGRGPGFCLQWGTIVEDPERTTCKHLHRKDLPMFLVREATEEHAEELSGAVAMADSTTHAKIAPRAPDPPQVERLALTTRAVAEYHAAASAPEATPMRRVLLLATFAGAAEAGRALAHACLVRRAMLGDLPRSLWLPPVLDLVQELDRPLIVDAGDRVGAAGAPEQTAALWETGLARLSGLQEYGRHAAVETLEYPMQELGASVADQDWAGFLRALGRLKQGFREQVLQREAERRDRISLKFPRAHAQEANVGATLQWPGAIRPCPPSGSRGRGPRRRACRPRPRTSACASWR